MFSNAFDTVCVDFVLWKTIRMNRFYMVCAALLLAAFISACAARPQLENRNPVNSAGVDLTGDWELRRESGAALPREGEQEQLIRVPKATSSREMQMGRQPSRRSSRPNGSAVQVFIETGKVLKITQTDYGVFVSYDRAVVEEFNFGENRVISIGPIEAQRVSGWDGARFIVETLDEDGARLFESWALESDGMVLVREIAILKGDDKQFETQQVFDRI